MEMWRGLFYEGGLSVVVCIGEEDGRRRWGVGRMGGG